MSRLFSTSLPIPETLFCYINTYMSWITAVIF